MFAYNAPFDKGAFDFTCQDFTVKNPFKNENWFDILGIANKYIHLSLIISILQHQMIMLVIAVLLKQMPKELLLS